MQLDGINHTDNNFVNYSNTEESAANTSHKAISKLP